MSDIRFGSIDEAPSSTDSYRVIIERFQMPPPRRQEQMVQDPTDGSPRPLRNRDQIRPIPGGLLETMRSETPPQELWAAPGPLSRSGQPQPQERDRSLASRPPLPRMNLLQEINRRAPQVDDEFPEEDTGQTRLATALQRLGQPIELQEDVFGPVRHIGTGARRVRPEPTASITDDHQPALIGLGLSHTDILGLAGSPTLETLEQGSSQLVGETASIFSSDSDSSPGAEHVALPPISSPMQLGSPWCPQTPWHTRAQDERRPHTPGTSESAQGRFLFNWTPPRYR